MKEKDELMKIKNTKENLSKMKTSAEKRVHAVLLEDILSTISTPTVVVACTSCHLFTESGHFLLLFAAVAW